MSDSAAAHLEPPTASPARRLVIAMGDIKLAHSVFALPFAVLGAFLVAPYLGDGPAHGVDWRALGLMLVLVIACMVFARTWAMLVNRVLDARIDAANPRTARRAFAAGRLSMKDGYTLLAIAAGGFMGCCALFGLLFGNWWPTALGIPVLCWIGFYSLTKRFTWLCHVFLGGALAASPVAAAIAVGPELLPRTPSVFWVAGMVLCWVAGFDIIYALQDLDYDRSKGLSSIPARFGWRGALWASRVLHLLAFACLLAALEHDQRLGTVFAAGIAAVVALLIVEHVILIKRGKAGIPMAFFTLNGLVSLVLGAAGCIDAVMG